MRRACPRQLLLGAVGLAVGSAQACRTGPPEPSPAEIAAEVQARTARALDGAFTRIRVRADSVDDVLDPVPFLRPAEEAGLRRYLGAEHLARARRLGVPPGGTGELDGLVAEGRLVALSDTTGYWVVRRLEHSVPYVTPSTRELLARLGRRFQARLEEMGLPAYRLEITSALRTAGDQAELRRVNPNAAAGTSTHEFGTTVDVAYSAFTAPVDPIVDPVVPDAPWLDSRVRFVADLAAERVAGRRSGELGAILGRVLREMQDRGDVLVTRESQQPVYHLTVARELADGGAGAAGG